MFKKVLNTFGKNHFLRSGKTLPHDEIIDYGEQLAKSQRILVLMPKDPEEFQSAIASYKALRNSLSLAKFTLVVHELHAQQLPAPLKINSILITAKDITPLGLVHKNFFKHFMKAFDLVIDMNFTFELCSTFIASRSDAKVRICFCHPEREPFYNLQFSTQEENTCEQRIAVMIKYITLLMK